MKFIKKALTTTLATALMLTCAQSYAKLHVINHSNIAAFTVKCGAFAGVPIPRGEKELSWSLVFTVLHGYSGTCSFYNKNVLQANASIQVSKNLQTAEITSLQVINPKLQVALKPGVRVSNRNITISVTGG